MKTLNTIAAALAVASAKAVNGTIIAAHAVKDGSLKAAQALGKAAGNAANATCQARNAAKEAFNERRAILHRAVAVKAVTPKREYAATEA